MKIKFILTTSKIYSSTLFTIFYNLILIDREKNNFFLAQTQLNDCINIQTLKAITYTKKER